MNLPVPSAGACDLASDAAKPPENTVEFDTLCLRRACAKVIRSVLRGQMNVSQHGTTKLVLWATPLTKTTERVMSSRAAKHGRCAGNVVQRKSGDQSAQAILRRS